MKRFLMVLVGTAVVSALALIAEPPVRAEDAKCGEKGLNKSENAVTWPMPKIGIGDEVTIRPISTESVDTPLPACLQALSEAADSASETTLTPPALLPRGEQNRPRIRLSDCRPTRCSGAARSAQIYVIFST